MKLNVDDKCPNCNVTIQDILNDSWSGEPDDPDRGLALPIRGNPTVIVCTRCGVLFVPKSVLSEVIEVSKPKRILKPAPKVALS